MSDLENLNSRIAEVIETNWGSAGRPLWLDVELDADEAWRVYLMHREAEALSPLHAELISRGNAMSTLEHWLRDLEGYGDAASMYVAIVRDAFLKDTAAKIAESLYLDEVGRKFTLDLDAWSFEVIPYYTLTRSDADETDQPLAGFLTIREVEQFVAKLDANPDEAWGLLEMAADDYSAAVSGGWGAYVPGELRRRRVGAQRAARRDAELEAAMSRHPAGKGRLRAVPEKIGELIDFPIGRLANGSAVTTPVRSIFPEDHSA